ncbi:putative fimbrial chaperone YraI [Stenotrophomonas maltophilia]|uniref:Fimbrial chaperone YraI n=1 Tax=Stenotrophomonas maltophilia TaxID=40324 RepID=A0AAX1IA14_STEMA|nr:fimbria/pilus chaperone family protein [Stenotrophomonas maltophilia]QGL80503.1 fimbrial chaperone protein [Stenotrophomonas maltophilia]QNG76129.1 putative fimbrial chaperone YraI [Stenotrophomonas maltophilia]
MSPSLPVLHRCILAISCALVAGNASANGMQPQSTIVILDEAVGEAAMDVTNTDATPALLHTVVLDIPEDPDTVVIATPPVARVDPGQQQMVRFIYQGPPLRTQRLKRVTFEGIGHSLEADGQAVVGIGIRQNLPLLLHPKGLARNNTPWTLLQWSREGDALRVTNDSPYVVRLTPSVTLQPSATVVTLQRPYVLPGESLTLPVSGNAGNDTVVRLEPASVYGFAVGSYDAPLK